MYDHCLMPFGHAWPPFRLRIPENWYDSVPASYLFGRMQGVSQVRVLRSYVTVTVRRDNCANVTVKLSKIGNFLLSMFLDLICFFKKPDQKLRRGASFQGQSQNGV